MVASDYAQHVRNGIGGDLLLMPYVGAVAWNDNGNVMLERVAEGWDIPSGPFHPGESPVSAVVRLVEEAVGLQVEARRLIGVFGGTYDFRQQDAFGCPVECTVIVMECVLQAWNLPTENIRKGQWFHPEELPTIRTPYPLEIFSRRAIDAGALFQWDLAWLEELEN